MTVARFSWGLFSGVAGRHDFLVVVLHVREDGIVRVSAAAARCLSCTNGAAAAPVRVDVVSKRTR